ncbi:MAG: SprT family zinc-dependent metalloprotease [Methanosarcinales archaeon]|nr:SprT family zinc-dependent metalloprotease [Methanosarcinales archaeon]
MGKHEITYGQHKIEYTLTRKNVSNINLNIKPNLLVEVSANHDVPIETVNKFVRKKASWILKNKEYFKKTRPEIKIDHEYVSGETFKYLGRQYRLKVIESKEECVKCQRGFFNLYIKDKNDITRKSRLIKQWYKEKSIRVFDDSLERTYKIVKKYDIVRPKISMRLMKARWGSCIENKNTILINTELIDAPKFCIDYVILHELIHFKYRNHDKNFYNMMDALMPDWKRRKEILDLEVVKNL